MTLEIAQLKKEANQYIEKASELWREIGARSVESKKSKQREQSNLDLDTAVNAAADAKVRDIATKLQDAETKLRDAETKLCAAEAKEKQLVEQFLAFQHRFNNNNNN